MSLVDGNHSNNVDDEEDSENKNEQTWSGLSGDEYFSELRYVPPPGGEWFIESAESFDLETGVGDERELAGLDSALDKAITAHLEEPEAASKRVDKFLRRVESGEDPALIVAELLDAVLRRSGRAATS